MKILLPEKYEYKDVAEVKNGILYIKRFGFFNDLMYDLTYNVKEVKKCYYCGKPLTRDKSTLDHIYPRDLGGPSLPNNLAISCNACNSAKSNMSEKEFFYYLSLPEIKRREFARDAIANKSYIKKWFSPFLPDEWVTSQKIDKIIVYFFPGEGVDGKSYRKVEKYYKKHERLYRPIIVDRYFKLLDGFNTLLFAKNHSIQKIQTIILENVELL